MDARPFLAVAGPVRRVRRLRVALPPRESSVPTVSRSVAVKQLTKRIMGGTLESHFLRRVQHEVCSPASGQVSGSPPSYLRLGPARSPRLPQVDIYRNLGQSLAIAHLYEAYEDAT